MAAGPVDAPLFSPGGAVRGLWAWHVGADDCGATSHGRNSKHIRVDTDWVGAARACRARATTFALGYFIVALLPVLGFFDICFFRYSYVADHFQYLAGVGLITLAVSVGATILQRAGQRGRELGTLAAAIALLLLGTAAWGQALRYKPDYAEAHFNPGRMLAAQGQTTEASEHYRIALDLANQMGNTALANAVRNQIKTTDKAPHPS